VKSCRGLSLPEATVEPWGLAGDRRWMLVDEAGEFVTQREDPLLATVVPTPVPSGLRLFLRGKEVEVPFPDAQAPRVEVSVWGDRLAARLAARFEPGLRLVYMDEPRARPVDPDYGRPEDRVSFADGFPLLLAATGSLDALNARLAAPLPMTRVRPNVVVAGAGAFEEDEWRQIRIGRVAFRVVKPCARCVVTTTDQATGARGGEKAEPLRTLATFRRGAHGVLFGQNLIPDGAGTIRVGDPVEVLRRRS
jgi:uncharacterized protein